MNAAATQLVNTPLARSARSTPPPGPGAAIAANGTPRRPGETRTRHPVNGPVIALLLHLLEPAQGAHGRTGTLVADLHRAVEAALAQQDTATHVTDAVHGAIEVTVQELRTAGLPAGRLAAYSRRLGRVREFITTTVATACDGAGRDTARNVVPLHGGFPVTGPRASTETAAVVALEFEPITTVEPAPNRRIPVDRIESCLAGDTAVSALSLLTEHGGTLAVRAAEDIDTQLARITARLRTVLRTQVTAAVLVCPAGQVRDRVDTVHEMLDVVRRLGYPHGIYRFDRIALEYQVTRPGPARASLSRIAASLEGHPDLIDALLVYIRSDGSRKLTARQLHVHPNTVDYRFRRIHQVTGYDPATVAGLSKLQAAMVVGAYEGRGYPGPSVPAPNTRSGPAVGTAV
ncbi:PucR family transcriptional regulator [Nocardia sp. CA-290969]|uniref:PucR family transcriptional regulator n=1 Tax=Nocardia sp. CA-290969 TaxID=3239986 RepID=UPI003D94C5C5